jgi:hypothetical protein
MIAEQLCATVPVHKDSHEQFGLLNKLFFFLLIVDQICFSPIFHLEADDLLQ